MKFTRIWALALIATLFFAGASFAQNDQDLIGMVAPQFALKNIDGKNVSLKDFSNEKGAIVIFTCNHCPYSKMYEDRIVALDAQYKEMGFPVVAINPNDPIEYKSDNFANMKKRAKEKGFTFPYLVDDSQEIAKAYGATRTPHVFLVVNEGERQVVRYVGAIDDNPQDEKGVETKFLETAIETIAKGETPDPDYTKAVGCGIKWKSFS